MSKKKELWLALAEDEFTCTVTVNDGPSGNFIEIILTGTLTRARLYVQDVIMSVVENSNYDAAILDARGLVFFTGHTVNDGAIEVLLKLVSYFCGNNKKIHLLLEDGCVKDVLKKDLPAKKFRSVDITDTQSAFMVKGRLDGGLRSL